MNPRVWENEVVAFLSHGRRSAGTRVNYERDLSQFSKWCTTLGYDRMSMDPAQTHEYLASLKRVGHAPATIERETNVLRLFYEFMLSRGTVDANPASSFRWTSHKPASRAVPSIDELRLLWEACKNDIQRTAVGLLGFCGLRPGEVIDASVTDLGKVDGVAILRLPNRQGAAIRPFVALPDQLVESIANLREDRPANSLIWRHPNRPHDRNSLRAILVALGSRVGIPYVLKPLDLTYCLRALAIEHGLPYAEVVRSVGELDARRLEGWVSGSAGPVSEHPALHIARRIFRTDSTVDFLGDADDLLGITDVHPAVAAAHGGAALERHLRLLTEEKNVVMTGEGKLSAYGARLKGARVIDNRALHLIGRIQDIRNAAAHGRFEDVPYEEAKWLIENARTIMMQYPLATPSSA